MNKKKLFSLFLLSVGVFLLIQIAMPFITYKIWEMGLSAQNTPLISSSPDIKVAGVSVSNSKDFPSIVSDNKRESKAPYDEFLISVPSIGLSNAKVKVESNNFDDSLAQLPGTALPGEKGNVFISGHSSLTQFYRADNYKAIFANLPKVKKGDQIITTAGSQQYTYKVIGLNVVDPKEVGVINPPDSQGRYLTLMTCVPPGLFLKRLIVLAELQ